MAKRYFNITKLLPGDMYYKTQCFNQDCEETAIYTCDYHYRSSESCTRDGTSCWCEFHKNLWYKLYSVEMNIHEIHALHQARYPTPEKDLLELKEEIETIQKKIDKLQREKTEMLIEHFCGLQPFYMTPKEGYMQEMINKEFDETIMGDLDG